MTGKYAKCKYLELRIQKLLKRKKNIIKYKNYKK